MIRCGARFVGPDTYVMPVSGPDPFASGVVGRSEARCSLEALSCNFDLIGTAPDELGIHSVWMLHVAHTHRPAQCMTEGARGRSAH